MKLFKNLFSNYDVVLDIMYFVFCITWSGGIRGYYFVLYKEILIRNSHVLMPVTYFNYWYFHLFSNRLHTNAKFYKICHSSTKSNTEQVFSGTKVVTSIQNFAVLILALTSFTRTENCSFFSTLFPGWCF